MLQVDKAMLVGTQTLQKAGTDDVFGMLSFTHKAETDIHDKSKQNTEERVDENPSVLVTSPPIRQSRLSTQKNNTPSGLPETKINQQQNGNQSISTIGGQSSLNDFAKSAFLKVEEIMPKYKRKLKKLVNKQAGIGIND